MEVLRYWRINKEKLGLFGNICRSCGNKNFPPKLVCPKCNHVLHPTSEVENTICKLQKAEVDLMSDI